MKTIAMCTAILFASLACSRAVGADTATINDPNQYDISVTTSDLLTGFFTHDKSWTGFDQGASVDLGNGRVLWIFADGAISTDGSGVRSTGKFIRNTIAIQTGYDPLTANVKFYWDGGLSHPSAFFKVPKKDQLPEHTWYWAGPGILIDGKATLLLDERRKVESTDSSESTNMTAAVIQNPQDDPTAWKITYTRLPDDSKLAVTQILKDEQYVYGFGNVVLGKRNMQAFLIRWNIKDFAAGKYTQYLWWYNGEWKTKTAQMPLPAPLFQTRPWLSVMYYAPIGKYIEAENIGFGAASLGFRFADNMQGPWSDQVNFFTPPYPTTTPWVYQAIFHPELKGDGIYMSYVINSTDKDDHKTNMKVYFTPLILVKISPKSGN